MKKIKIISKEWSYDWDLTRIINAMAAKGYICSREEARILWKKYSDSMCASWLILPKDHLIVESIRPYFEVVEDCLEESCENDTCDCYYHK